MSSDAPSADASKAGSSDTNIVTETTAPSLSSTSPVTGSTARSGDSMYLAEEWYFARTGQRMSDFRLSTATPGCHRSTEPTEESK